MDSGFLDTSDFLAFSPLRPFFSNGHQSASSQSSVFRFGDSMFDECLLFSLFFFFLFLSSNSSLFLIFTPSSLFFSFFLFLFLLLLFFLLFLPPRLPFPYSSRSFFRFLSHRFSSSFTFSFTFFISCSCSDFSPSVEVQMRKSFIFVWLISFIFARRVSPTARAAVLHYRS